jgi:hypothetical protein
MDGLLALKRIEAVPGDALKSIEVASEIKGLQNLLKAFFISKEPAVSGQRESNPLKSLKSRGLD